MDSRRTVAFVCVQAGVRVCKLIHTNSLQCCAEFKWTHGPRGVLIKLEKDGLKEKHSVRAGDNGFSVFLSHTHIELYLQIA